MASSVIKAPINGVYFQKINNGIRFRFRDANDVERILLITETQLALFDSEYHQIWDATITVKTT